MEEDGEGTQQMKEEEEKKEEEEVDQTFAEEKRNYIKEFDIQNVLNSAVNEIMESRPDDIFGVLSKIMKRHAAKPVIDHLVGREVLDSRGNPTVEVDVYAKYLNEVSFVGRSSAPSGASTGSNEAKELRDEDPQRYNGKGTLKAVENVSTQISDALKGKEFYNIAEIDQIICELDGTELKENLGGNATTATSFAIATSAALIHQEPLFIYLAKQYYGEGNIPSHFSLPTPFFNVLNGGKHAGGNLKIQEFMITPRRDITFPEQLRIITQVYHKLGELLVKKYGVSSRNLGDEGGYAPPLQSPEEALNILERSVSLAGYRPGIDVLFAIDAAASEFYDQTKKLYEVETGVFKTSEEMIEYWKELIEKHHGLVSIEDALDEKDYENWIKLNEELGSKIQLVGDDLYTTNPKTIAQGIEEKWCNALLLKVNQIGTISEGMEAAKLVLNANQNVMVSHRSGETCNSLIADLAVAIGAQFIKTGSTARGERIEKYTRLLQIYDYLKNYNMLRKD